MSFSSDQPLLSNQLPISVELPRDNNDLLVETLELLYKRIANSTNSKVGGLYNLVENAAFQQYFSPQATVTATGNAFAYRDVYRKTFEIGAIAAGATLTTAHGITGLVALTNVYGAVVTNVVDYRAIPYVSATAVNTQISVRVDGTNFIIVNGAAAPAITSGSLVIEFLKQ